MNRKLNLTVMLGGPSAEREVSLRSGAAVVAALRSIGHTVSELDPRDANWVLPEKTDVVFLALHGTYGEDGTVQQQLEKLGVPFTGCDSEASRIAFDKLLTKQSCIEQAVPTPKFLMADSAETPWPLGWQPPMVVKPVRQGSSVGLQFVNRVEEWHTALAESLRYDSDKLRYAGRLSGRAAIERVYASIAPIQSCCRWWAPACCSPLLSSPNS